MNPAIQSYYDKLTTDRQDVIDWVKKYRAYTEGDSEQVLSRKQIKLLKPDGGDLYYKLNVCDLLVTTETDRLKLRGVTMVLPPMMGGRVDPRAQQATDLNALIASWFKSSRTDRQAKGLHYASARDGDSYAIVEPFASGDGSSRRYIRPRIIFREAYDGETGVDMVYLDNDPSKPLYATNTWIAEVKNETGVRVLRQNVYLPDRVLKLVSDSTIGSTAGTWLPYTADGTLEVIETYLNGVKLVAGVQWWTKTGKEGGEPLGIPVIHFPHNPNGSAYGRSTLADVVPDLQDRLNRAAAALEYATLFAGFNVHVLLGGDIGDDPANPDTSSNSVGSKIEAVPGMIFHVGDAAASVATLSATNLEQLIRVKESCLRDIAMVSKTPLPMLNPSGDVAAEGTLQQMEAPLLAKTASNHTVYGNGWEDATRMMLKIDATFEGGQTSMTYEEIDNLDLTAEWDDPETRNEATEIANAISKQSLGIPNRQLQKELGYSPDEIASFEVDAMAKRNAVIAGLGNAISQMEAQNNAFNNGTNEPVATVGSNGRANGNGARGDNGMVDREDGAGDERG